MNNDGQYDGEIRLKTDPRNDFNNIEKLPPEVRGYAYVCWWKNQLQALELIKFKFDEFGRSVLLVNGIDTSLENGFKTLLRKQKDPLWPKTQKTWREWGFAWRAMQRLKKKYSTYFDNGEVESEFIKSKEYSEYLANELKIFGYNGKAYSTRLIQEIRKAGKAGYLQAGREGTKD